MMANILVNHSNLETVFDKDLIKRYDRSGPRYTSYPTAVQFHEKFSLNDYARCAEQSNLESRTADKTKPLSVYFHIPFCDTVCFYCACSKVATKDRSKAQPYLEQIFLEIELQSQLFDHDRMVEQLHWGGGTPTFISHEQIMKLMDATRECFSLYDDDQGEYSIEIDPREVNTDTIRLLRSCGFNRMSMGVQDFDSKVQKAVNRIQPKEVTFRVLDDARSVGFKSVSVDLIYGLPMQTVDSFSQTIEQIIEVSPDRLSVFNYAHLPEMFKPQRRINVDDLPSSEEKLEILANTMQQLHTAGYLYIGMDHFAKPDDELAIAQKNGTLYRNFQGYSTHADCDLIAMGITAISKVGNSYSQNVKTLDEYSTVIHNSQLPIYRGFLLDTDDLLRRHIISQLICNFNLDIKDTEDRFSIIFGDYFARELVTLQTMQTDKLLTVDEHAILVSSKGRLLIRNICMMFDKYLQHFPDGRFSKLI